MPDISINGLPAAAKSTILASLLSSEDLIVVPTKQLKAEFEVKFAHIGCTIRTQHSPLLKRRNQRAVDRYRLVVIDEAYLLECAHVSALAALGDRCIAVGDYSQIAGFHTRSGIRSYGYHPSYARFRIRAPFSLAVPIDILRIGILLGFCPSDAVTFNSTPGLEILELGVDRYYDPEVDGDHAVLVFNQARKRKDFLTAHESQGSRFRSADVLVHDDEQHFIPTSGHFWVALTRATNYTRLFLCPAAAQNLRLATTPINGSTAYLDRSRIIAIVNQSHQSFLSSDDRAFRPLLIQAIAAYGVEGERTEVELTPSSHKRFEFPREPPPQLTATEISCALVTVNLNVDELKYDEIVDTLDLIYPDPLTVRAIFRLDLQASPHAPSTLLTSAGVPFRSDDASTETHTIIDRYLCNVIFKSNRTAQIARELVRAFDRAYIDSSKTVVVPSDRARLFVDWMSSRENATFNPTHYSFGESRATTQFSSFIKQHAKAKNKVGFGLKIEKGQTISAGDQSYNARFTTLCRQMNDSLQQVLRSDVILDIGFSDHDFEHRSVEVGLYSEDNTQIDLDSQDSSHREHHVLSFIELLFRYTDITSEEATLYYNMRKHFVVRARNYNNQQCIVYEQSWSLPSGDPFTLLANCIHESTSTAYAFDLTADQAGACVIKGDDQYYKRHLVYSTAVKDRCSELGVSMKIEHGLPPFVVGRFILPDSTIYNDPVKHAAKYSVRRSAPELVESYSQAMSDLFPQPSPATFDLVCLYALAHHPNMLLPDISLLFRFVLGLSYPDFYRSFQNPEFHHNRHIVDAPTDCFNHVLGALRAPRVPRAELSTLSTLNFILHLEKHNVPFLHLPGATHEVIRQRSLGLPHTVVLNDNHCVVFTDSY